MLNALEKNAKTMSQCKEDHTKQLVIEQSVIKRQRRVPASTPSDPYRYLSARDWPSERFLTLLYEDIVPVPTQDALLADIESHLDRPGREILFEQVVDFLRLTKMSPSLFGKLAASDDKILYRIGGAPNGISLDKADRVRSFMATYLRDLRDGKIVSSDTEQATSSEGTGG